MINSNFQPVIRIGEREIGEGHPVFVIAEAGVNHFGSLERALQLVDLAVDAKADVFKTQVYQTAQLISSTCKEWVDRMRPKELNAAQIQEICAYCRSKGIIFLATAHEPTSLQVLEDLNVPAYKIGSGEIHNWDYIEEIARRGKPLIVSTGMYTLKEVEALLTCVAKTGNSQLALLHCVTLYPTPPEHVNLNALELLRKVFPGPIGYSDHTIGTEIVLAAVALGATIIEKHITLDRNVPNAQDWIVASGPEDFPSLVRAIRNVELARGQAQKMPGPAELQSKQWARKSLVARTNIPAGTLLEREMICLKRPGTGISPELIDQVVGKTAKERIEQDSLIRWDQIMP